MEDVDTLVLLLLLQLLSPNCPDVCVIVIIITIIAINCPIVIIVIIITNLSISQSAGL